MARSDQECYYSAQLMPWRYLSYQLTHSVDLVIACHNTTSTVYIVLIATVFISNDRNATIRGLLWAVQRKLGAAYMPKYADAIRES